MKLYAYATSTVAAASQKGHNMYLLKCAALNAYWYTLKAKLKITIIFD